MSAAVVPTRPPGTLRRVAKVVFTLSFFLLPAFLGFGNKLLEFFMLLGDEDGAFAVTPILNYLLTTAGFFFLLCWATMHGMFREIERPKDTLLSTERLLDEELMPVARREDHA